MADVIQAIDRSVVRLYQYRRLKRWFFQAAVPSPNCTHAIGFLGRNDMEAAAAWTLEKDVTLLGFLTPC